MKSPGDRAVIYGTLLATGMLIGMSFPAKPETQCTAVSGYEIAESLGCQEVSNVCRARKRSEAISNQYRRHT